MKYKARISKSEKDQSKEQQQYQIEDNQRQLEADLVATSRVITGKKRELEQLKSAPMLSSEDILNCQDQLNGHIAGKEALEALIKELF